MLIAKVSAVAVAHSAEIETEYGITMGGKPARQRHELSVRPNTILWTASDDDDDATLSRRVATVQNRDQVLLSALEQQCRFGTRHTVVLTIARSSGLVS